MPSSRLCCSSCFIDLRCPPVWRRVAFGLLPVPRGLQCWHGRGIAMAFSLAGNAASAAIQGRLVRRHWSESCAATSKARGVCVGPANAVVKETALDTPRKSLLQWPILTAIIAVAILNGRPFSPYFDPMLFWLGKLAGRAYAASPIVFHGTSVALTAMTLFVAGIPALLLRLAYARGSIVPGLVWLAAVVAASWPALRILLGIGD